MGDDYIDAEPDEFFSKLLGTIAPPVGIAEIDRSLAPIARSLMSQLGHWPPKFAVMHNAHSGTMW